MTRLQLARKKFLNERVLLCCGIGTLKFDVDVLDVQLRFGRIDLHVAPAGSSGEGKGWISSRFVELPKRKR